MPKAITLHQPWATLIALGAKQYETRGWGTAFRGKLVIHAGSNTSELKRLAEVFAEYGQKPGSYLPPYERHLVNVLGLELCRNITSLPLGAAVAVVDLVNCVQMTPDLLTEISSQEYNFGHWKPGRVAWKLANVQKLDPPIRAYGKQGLWDWKLALPSNG